MTKIISKQEFIKKANDIHNNKYDYSKFDYVNSSTKGIIICLLHGEFLQSPNKHTIAKQQCPKCSKKHKYSTEEYIEEVKKVHNNYYQYDKTDYTGSHNYIIVTCPKHGDFKLKSYSHINGQGCAGCKKEKIGSALRISLYDRIKQFKKIHNDKYDYSLISEIKSKNDKVSIICKEHGIFNQRVASHANGQGCPKCAQINSRLLQEDFISKCKSIHEDLYDYSKIDFQGLNSRITIICKIHGEFNQRAGNHLNGNRCPKCNKVKQISSQEITIQNFLKSHNIDFVSSERTKIYPKELDIFIPYHNLAIEINGIYWHSDKFKDKNYHLNKKNECTDKGISLLQFTDIDVNKKLKIIKSMIESRLNLSKRIFARKCEIREVPVKESRKFQEENHLQGYAHSKIILGLYYKDEMVAIMTFGKPRFNKKYEWELIRFCSKNGINIIGGASKLIKYFIRNYKPKNILTYANRDYSDGNLYKKLGFNLIGESSPSYQYTKDGIEYLSRYQCQKKKLKNLLGTNFDNNLTESENMKKAGYQKIYDSGNYIFEMTII